MEYIFTQNKDGHKKGEIIELKPNDFSLFYWQKKRVIEPFCREQTLAIDAQEPVIETAEPVAPAEKPKRRRRK